MSYEKAYFKALGQSYTSFGEKGKSYVFPGKETAAPTLVEGVREVSKFRFDEHVVETTKDGKPLESDSERHQRNNPPKSFTGWNDDRKKGIECDPKTGKPVNPQDAAPKIAVARQTDDGVVAEVQEESQVSTLDSEPELDIVMGGGDTPAPPVDRFENAADLGTTGVKARELGFKDTGDMFANLNDIGVVDLRKLAAGKLESVEYRGKKKAHLVPKLQAWWAAKQAEQQIPA